MSIPLIIAHRGASACEPENSLAAFRRAIAQGADGIELDVRETADGELVVLHDPTLAGRAVDAMTAQEVRTYRLANGEPVPTLGTALEAIGDHAAAFLELKRTRPQGDRRLLALIETSPARTTCHVHSFDHRVVRRLAGASPALGAGVLSVSYVVDPVAQVTAAGATTLWQQADLIDAELVAALHGADLRVYAWTVDAPDRMRALAALGVDAICTNTPDVGREVLR